MKKNISQLSLAVNINAASLRPCRYIPSFFSACDLRGVSVKSCLQGVIVDQEIQLPEIFFTGGYSIPLIFILKATITKVLIDSWTRTTH